MNNFLFFCCLLLSGLATGAMFWFRRGWPLGADEGYLWYGVQRTLRGELAHRNFKSYEPGRYWWCGLFLTLLPPSLVTLRFSQHLFYIVSLWVTLSVLYYADMSHYLVLACGFSLVLWTFPQHKLFEHGILMLGSSACMGVFLAPSEITVAFLGIIAGMSLIFGFNLFLYVSAASGAVLLTQYFLLDLKDLLMMLAVFVVATVIGSLPFSLALVVDKAFRQRFFERRVINIIKRGSSNLRLSVPLPFKTTPRHWQILNTPRQYLVKWLFICLLLVPVLVLILLFVIFLSGHEQFGAGDSNDLSPSIATISGAACAAILCWHHAFSRADKGHLAQSLAPFIVLCFVLADVMLPDVVDAILLLLFFAYLAWPMLEDYRRITTLALMPMKADGNIRMAPLNQRLYDWFQVKTEEQEPIGNSVLALPNLVWLYALADIKAPVYDMYCVYPATVQQQSDMISQAESNRVTHVLIANRMADNQEQLRFSNTHPIVWSWLSDNFECQMLEVKPPIAHFSRKS